jgi:hypothetical protein
VSVRVALVAAVLAALLLPASASAEDFVAESGTVRATLSYQPVPEEDFTAAPSMRLTVVRAGQVVHDQPLTVDGCGGPYCQPARPRGRPLVVTDLDRDDEPEVLASVYWGGAHCCFIEHVFTLNRAGAGYDTIVRNLADPGARVRDLDRDGSPELVSADARVASAITGFMRLPYAASAPPLQVWRLRDGALADVTRSFRRRLRTDARRWWRAYRRSLRTDLPALGMLGGWAADQYSLGRRRHARRVLRRERRRGHLRAVDWYTGKELGGRRYIRKLDRALRRHGYVRR